MENIFLVCFVVTFPPRFWIFKGKSDLNLQALLRSEFPLTAIFRGLWLRHAPDIAVNVFVLLGIVISVSYRVQTWKEMNIH